MKVSIIISTSNRAQSLRNALVSLEKMKYSKREFEVLVVDGSFSNETKNLVEVLQKQVTYDLLYYPQPGSNLSAARNHGVRQSRGQILVFTDDDCEFEPEWLAKLTQPFNERRNPGAVGGTAEIPPNSPVMAKCIDWVFSSFVGSGGIHGKLGPKLSKFYPMGCNMAIPRMVLDKVGFFNETLQPGEDTELALRVEKAGYDVMYVDQAFVWHTKRTGLFAFAKYIYLRAMARAKLLLIYKVRISRFQIVYFVPGIMLSLFLMLSYAALTFSSASVVLASCLAIYLSILLVSAAHSTFTVGLSALIVVPMLFIVQHVVYGVGFLFWVVRIKLGALRRRKKP